MIDRGENRRIILTEEKEKVHANLLFFVLQGTGRITQIRCNGTACVPCRIGRNGGDPRCDAYLGKTS